MEAIIRARNCVNRFLYNNVLKRIFFRIGPEKIHDGMTLAGRFLGCNPVTRALTALAFSYSNKKLEQEILGIRFPNPIGLAAGFDKDARLTGILPSIGFGFAELGSITGEPCEGNPKPRLWRLKRSKGLVVYYGLKNEGCERISERLKGRNFRIPIGTSIAKTNSRKTVELQPGIRDYAKAYKKFVDIGSYYTINISCPNAFGGEPFTDPKKLDLLLRETGRTETGKPVFLKISPDLSRKNVDGILEAAGKHKVKGFICTNLTKNRDNSRVVDEVVPGKGGMSGKVVEELSNGLIRYVYQKTKGEFVIIGCGGVFSAEDAYRKIRLGASLIQLITGMVFEGPQVIGEINQGLVRLLERDGLNGISEAVGLDARQ